MPEGIHFATQEEITARFGAETSSRQSVTASLLRVLQLAENTGKLKRFLVYGSDITDKPAPNDVDVFLVMAADLDSADDAGETAARFDHQEADRIFGASLFWATTVSSPILTETLLDLRQTTHDETKRGILEIQR